MPRRNEGADRPTADDPRPAAKGLRHDFDARARAARDDFEAQLRQRRASFDARRASFDARNEALTARTGRNLPAAIAIALAFAVVMLGSLLIQPAFFMIVAAFLTGFGVYELASAMRFRRARRPAGPSVVVGVAMVPAAFLGGQVQALFTILGGIVLITLWRLVEVAVARQRPTAGNVARDLTNGLFVQAYVTLLCACVVLLSALPRATCGSSASSWWWSRWTPARTPPAEPRQAPDAPRISPKKTWRASPVRSPPASSSGSWSPGSCSLAVVVRQSSSVCSSPARRPSAT